MNVGATEGVLEVWSERDKFGGGSSHTDDGLTEGVICPHLAGRRGVRRPTLGGKSAVLIPRGGDYFFLV